MTMTYEKYIRQGNILNKLFLPVPLTAIIVVGLGRSYFKQVMCLPIKISHGQWIRVVSIVELSLLFNNSHSYYIDYLW